MTYLNRTESSGSSGATLLMSSKTRNTIIARLKVYWSAKNAVDSFQLALKTFVLMLSEVPLETKYLKKMETSAFRNFLLSPQRGTDKRLLSGSLQNKWKLACLQKTCAFSLQLCLQHHSNNRTNNNQFRLFHDFAPRGGKSWSIWQQHYMQACFITAEVTQY